MFLQAGRLDNTHHFPGNLAGWDVSKGTDMSYMFYACGYYQTSYYLGDLSVWDTGACTDMNSMFAHCFYTASYSLDLSGWDVDLVTDHTDFNKSVTSKITAPTWAA